MNKNRFLCRFWCALGFSVIALPYPALADQTIRTIKFGGDKYNVLVRNSTTPESTSSLLISNKKFQKILIDYDSNGTIDAQEIQTKKVRVRQSLPLRNQYFRIEYWMDEKEGIRHYVYNLVEHRKSYLLTRNELVPWRIWYNSENPNSCDPNNADKNLNSLQQTVLESALTKSPLFDKSCKTHPHFPSIVSGVAKTLSTQESCFEKLIPHLSLAISTLPFFSIEEDNKLQKITCHKDTFSSANPAQRSINLNPNSDPLKPQEYELSAYYKSEMFHELLHIYENWNEEQVKLASQCCSGSSAACSFLSHDLAKEARSNAAESLLAQLPDSEKLFQSLHSIPKEVQSDFMKSIGDGLYYADQAVEKCLSGGNSDCDEEGMNKIYLAHNHFFKTNPWCTDSKNQVACTDLKTNSARILEQFRSCPAGMSAPTPTKTGFYRKVLERLSDFLLPTSVAATSSVSCMKERMKDFGQFLPNSEEDQREIIFETKSVITEPSLNDSIEETLEDHKNSDSSHRVDTNIEAPSSPSSSPYETTKSTSYLSKMGGPFGDAMTNFISSQIESSGFITNGFRTSVQEDLRRFERQPAAKKVVVVNFGSSIPEMRELIRNSLAQGSILDDIKTFVSTLKSPEFLHLSENKAPSGGVPIGQLVENFKMKSWSPNLIKTNSKGALQANAQQGAKGAADSKSDKKQKVTTNQNSSGPSERRGQTMNTNLGGNDHNRSKTFPTVQDLIDFLTSNYETVHVELKKHWLTLELKRHNVFVIDHKGHQYGPSIFQHKLIFSKKAHRLIVL